MFPKHISKGLLLLPLLLAAIAACSDNGSQNAQGQVKEVGYVTVKPQAVPVETTLGGRVVAYATSEVRPQITGVIRRRYFTEGGYVRAGQPLFQIDPSLYRAAVNEASADLASAEASAAAASAKADRFRPLADMEAIAKQDYTDAEAQARMAKAAVAQKRAALETARINMRFTTVPAPISGRIGRSLFTMGALVSAGQSDPLAVIQSIDPVYVDMQQSSADLTRLRNGFGSKGLTGGSAAVHLKLEDGTSYDQTGRVEFSEVTVDQSTGTVTLRARFPNPDGVLLPGMFVTAVFDQAINPNAYLVPQAALQRDFDGSAFVFIAGKDSKAYRRKVNAERTVGPNWVVTEGLKTGERIITEGISGLVQGAAIKPVAASKQKKPDTSPPPKEASAKADD
ncbi:efflux transporter periplasmic adaptor subunit [Croceicoccus estronivorus]|uniref:efflux RND transporter periplasmic adaptor subunit n=1 Tax=Croceicoccus estronivorus TaxID=1172626 RepID=UPI00083294CB|nr:efflux RND transporter periplasmic adaptor subunit [Croceicoccus estronivorus]OCC24160.1 efflux transporter periplasmic adaptor subunit [Croceicoccus estronivorus]